ncbi:MAG: sigma-70 family RNA polymerase sigma factor [Negativibacillus massiliensis]|jgi:RNA polymerase sigma factor (sigma-70 family)|nr:sigma-70 family RNA polymerase sigma factor [Negativibacillus massiliensis]MCI6348913.1 sigma-70 family RNA polymerase sigma factor [Negativibacillus massiliensis]MDY4048429.1 sigma-70 family RNA polymerase sigma factor [Negativibacillus massiliensis]CDA79190.1 sigma-70 region 4 [Clostridium sp. CAG:242]
MSREIASCHIEHYPDLMTCFQGQTNRREREEYRRFLYRAIKTQLTHRQTQVMLLYYFEGKNITEIAQELGLNKSTVSRTLRRSLNRLTDLARLYFEIK